MQVGCWRTVPTACPSRNLIEQLQWRFRSSMAKEQISQARQSVTVASFHHEVIRQAYTLVGSPEMGPAWKWWSSLLPTGSTAQPRCLRETVWDEHRRGMYYWSLSRWPEGASVQRLNQESCHQEWVLELEPSVMNREEACFSVHEYSSEMLKGYVWALDIRSEL